MIKYPRLFLRSVAGIVLTAFLTTNTGYAAAGIPQKLSSELTLPSSFNIQLPTGTGKVESLIAGQGAAVVHIQTAHGNYTAQKNIQKILKHLKENYGFNTVLVEGGAGKLEPEVLNFFPDNLQKTLAVNEELTRRAIVKGHDLFLLENKTAQGFGIEEAAAYKQNAEAFKSVIRAREKSKKFIEAADIQIGRLAAAFLNKDLRSFLERQKTYEAGQIPLGDWIVELKNLAVKKMKMDPSSPQWQYDWPMMLRYFKLGEFSRKMDVSGLAKEKGKFLKLVRRYSFYEEAKKMLETPAGTQLPAPQTELAVEKWISELPANFNYAAFPNLNRFIGTLILQSELDGVRLYEEISRLNSVLTDALAVTAEEKKLTALLESHRLLQKLFALELTAGEYEQIINPEKKEGRGERGDQSNRLSSPFSLLPSALIKQFEIFQSEKRVRNIRFEHTAELDQVYERALEFYRLAQKRDGIMIENTVKNMKAAGIEKAVVITGGFHSKPFEDYFSLQGMNYALITPTISLEDLEAGRKTYIDAMFQGKTQAATLDTPEAAALRGNYLGDFNWLRGQLPVVGAVRSESRDQSDAAQEVDPKVWQHSGIKNLIVIGAPTKETKSIFPELNFLDQLFPNVSDPEIITDASALSSEALKSKNSAETLVFVESKLAAETLPKLGGLNYILFDADSGRLEIDKRMAEDYAANVDYTSALGRPLAGKGTAVKPFMKALNELLPEEKRPVSIVMGDLFRGIAVIVGYENKHPAGIPEDSALDEAGIKAKKAYLAAKNNFGHLVQLVPPAALDYMNQGKMVPNAEALAMLKAVLQDSAYKGKIILFDGFPRTLPQLEAVGELFPGARWLNFILDVPADTILERVTMRAEQAKGRGEPPRPDDDPDKARKRLDEYFNLTKPVVDAKRSDADTFSVSGFVRNVLPEESQRIVWNRFAVGFKLKLEEIKRQRDQELKTALLGSTDALEWAKLIDSYRAADSEKTNVTIQAARGISMNVPLPTFVLKDPELKDAVSRYLALWAYNLSIIYGTSFVGIGSAENPGLIDVEKIKFHLTEAQGGLSNIRESLNKNGEHALGISDYANAGRRVEIKDLALLTQEEQTAQPVFLDIQLQQNVPGTYLGIDIGGGSAKFAVVKNGRGIEVPNGLKSVPTLKTDSKGAEIKETPEEYVARLAAHVQSIQTQLNLTFDGVGIDAPGAAEFETNRMVTLGQIPVKKNWNPQEVQEAGRNLPAKIAELLKLSPEKVKIRNDMDGVLPGVAAVLAKALPEFWERTEGNFRFDWMGTGHGFQFASSGVPMNAPTEAGHMIYDFGRGGDKIFDTESRTSIPSMLAYARELAAARNISWNEISGDELKPLADSALSTGIENNLQAKREIAQAVFQRFAQNYAANLALGYRLTEASQQGTGNEVLLGGGIARGETGNYLKSLTEKELQKYGLQDKIRITVITDDQIKKVGADPDTIGAVGSAYLIQSLLARSESRGEDIQSILNRLVSPGSREAFRGAIQTNKFKDAMRVLTGVGMIETDPDMGTRRMVALLVDFFADPTVTSVDLKVEVAKALRNVDFSETALFNSARVADSLVNNFPDRSRTDLKPVIDELRKGDAARSEVRPLKVFLAETGSTEKILKLAAQYLGQVEFVTETNVKDKAKYLEILNREKPDVILVRSQFDLKDKDVLEAIAQYSEGRRIPPVILRGGSEAAFDEKEAASLDLAVVRTNGGEESVAETTLAFFANFLSRVMPNTFLRRSVAMGNDVRLQSAMKFSPSIFREAVGKSEKAGRGGLTETQLNELFPGYGIRDLRGAASVLSTMKIGLAGWNVIPPVVAEKIKALGTVLGAQAEIGAWSPSIEEGSKKPEGVKVLTKAEMLRESNVISIHLPTKAGEFLTAEDLKVLADRAGPINPIAIINTSRLQNVNHQALLENLRRIKKENGRVDLYYYSDIDLAKNGQEIEILKQLRTEFPNNVFMSNHIAAFTQPALDAVEARVVSNIEALIQAHQTGDLASGNFDYLLKPAKTTLLQRSETREGEEVQIAPGQTYEFPSMGRFDIEYTLNGEKIALRVDFGSYSGVLTYSFKGGDRLNFELLDQFPKNRKAFEVLADQKTRKVTVKNTGDQPIQLTPVLPSDEWTRNLANLTGVWDSKRSESRGEMLADFNNGEVSEFSKIQALLSAYYGGSVQYYIKTAAESGKAAWKTRFYEFSPESLEPQERNTIKARLAQLGINVEQKINIEKGEPKDLGVILHSEGSFKNPYYQTVFGQGGRLDKVAGLLNLSDDQEIYLKKLDYVFAPEMTLGEHKPFAVRIQHNNVLGPNKGGIRFVFPENLTNDPHLKKVLDTLASQQVSEPALKYFLRKYLFEETAALSVGMSSKAAVMGLPYGGAKGTMSAADIRKTAPSSYEIYFSGNDLSAGGVRDQKKRIARNFARELAEAEVAAPYTDIPAADLNSGPFMKIMADEQIEVAWEKLKKQLEENPELAEGLSEADQTFIEKLKVLQQHEAESLEDPSHLRTVKEYLDSIRALGQAVPAVLKSVTEAAAVYTSKPADLLGSAFRPESTGVGGIEVLEAIKGDLSGKTVKIAGFGQVGGPAAEALVQKGAQLTFISLGPLGGLKKTGGFTEADIKMLKKLISEKGNFYEVNSGDYNVPGAVFVPNDNLESTFLSEPAEIMVLAAVENAVHEQNLAQVKAAAILELANGGVTNGAYEQLLKNGVEVIPDTLANGGGVTVSYFEWLQNLRNERWPEAQVRDELSKMIKGALSRVKQVKEQFNTDWRTAADIVAVQKILDARSARSENRAQESEGEPAAIVNVLNLKLNVPNNNYTLGAVLKNYVRVVGAETDPLKFESAKWISNGNPSGAVQFSAGKINEKLPQGAGVLTVTYKQGSTVFLAVQLPQDKKQAVYEAFTNAQTGLIPAIRKIFNLKPEVTEQQVLERFAAQSNFRLLIKYAEQKKKHSFVLAQKNDDLFELGAEDRELQWGHDSQRNLIAQLLKEKLSEDQWTGIASVGSGWAPRLLELYRLSVPAARSEMREIKFGMMSPEYLAANRHRMVPIFISGGEGPGVNDYFGYAAQELLKQGLIPVAVKNGIKGLTQKDFAAQLLEIDNELAQEFLGVGGALAGSSRVKLSAKGETELAQTKLTIENMKGFKGFLAIGGGDHAVFWTKFVRDLEKAEAPQEVIDGAKEIAKKMIVVYKTIDGDTHGQPMGLYGAAEAAQRKIYAAAASGAAMDKVTVLPIMGADVGRLPVLAGSRNPWNLNFLQSSRRVEDIALLKQIERYGDQIVILIPEISVSLQQIVNQVNQKTAAVVVVSEGFEIKADDPLLLQMIDPQAEVYSPKAAIAWAAFAKAPRDAHGNVKRSALSVETIVAEAIAKFSTFKDPRLDGKIGYADLRGLNPTFSERMYSRLLAEMVAGLIAENKFGVVVSLPPDSSFIKDNAVKYFTNQSLQVQQPSLEEFILAKAKAENPLRVQSFEEVRATREEKGLYDSLQAWSVEQLREAGVLVPENFRSEIRREDVQKTQALGEELMKKLQSVMNKLNDPKNEFDPKRSVDEQVLAGLHSRLNGAQFLPEGGLQFAAQGRPLVSLPLGVSQAEALKIILTAAYQFKNMDFQLNRRAHFAQVDAKRERGESVPSWDRDGDYLPQQIPDAVISARVDYFLKTYFADLPGIEEVRRSETRQPEDSQEAETVPDFSEDFYWARAVGYAGRTQRTFGRIVQYIRSGSLRTIILDDKVIVDAGYLESEINQQKESLLKDQGRELTAEEREEKADARTLADVSELAAGKVMTAILDKMPRDSQGLIPQPGPVFWRKWSTDYSLLEIVTTEKLLSEKKAAEAAERKKEGDQAEKKRSETRPSADSSAPRVNSWEEFESQVRVLHAKAGNRIIFFKLNSTMSNSLGRIGDKAEELVRHLKKVTTNYSANKAFPGAMILSLEKDEAGRSVLVITSFRSESRDISAAVDSMTGGSAGIVFQYFLAEVLPGWVDSAARASVATFREILQAALGKPAYALEDQTNNLRTAEVLSGTGNVSFSSTFIQSIASGERLPKNISTKVSQQAGKVLLPGQMIEDMSLSNPKALVQLLQGSGRLKELLKAQDAVVAAAVEAGKKESLVGAIKKMFSETLSSEKAQELSRKLDRGDLIHFVELKTGTEEQDYIASQKGKVAVWTYGESDKGGIQNVSAVFHVQLGVKPAFWMPISGAALLTQVAAVLSPDEISQFVADQLQGFAPRGGVYQLDNLEALTQVLLSASAFSTSA